MRFIADLHIHSRFSRATSKSLTPEQLVLWAGRKGISVLGTGDFTHPGWLAELEEKLLETENGLFSLQPDIQRAVRELLPDSCRTPVRFLFSGEISCIYKKNGQTRKVHHLILMPDPAAVRRFNARLSKIGNLHSDGRPILGLGSRDLLEIVLEIDERSFLIPAHIWTPWFSLFGSKSGFDTLEECFEDLSGHIHALETGLSSDPPMNRLLSALDNYLLVSNSDAHSGRKLGREANIFETELDYVHMLRALTTGKGFGGTIEFYPEEGKYHLDGHRKCAVTLQPEETLNHRGLCPVCGKPLTVGVLHRVHALADRQKPEFRKPYYSLIPLTEIIAELLDCGPATKRVDNFYQKLLRELGPELRILLDVPFDETQAHGGPLLAEALDRMRRNRVIRQAGFDGEFGVIRLFEKTEKAPLAGQATLFEPSFKRSPKKKAAAERVNVKQARRMQSSQTTLLPPDPILDPLNPEQKAAVKHTGKYLLVAAGPGTGKTMTLTHRVAYLIREGLAGPDRILALTFTRKAAREMTDRIAALTGRPDEQNVYIATFHGFCLDLLRREQDKSGLPRNFTLCTERDAAALARAAFSAEGAAKRLLSRFLKNLSNLKAGAVTGESRFDSEPEITACFASYQSRLREMGMLDLDDLEVEALRLLMDDPPLAEAYARRFPWIFVDEYQDTNHLQVRLLKTLVKAGPVKLFAIGDSDQAIYGFRGAAVENFLRFQEDFPGAAEVVLARNYRSTANILSGAAALMQKPQALQSTLQGAEPIFLSACRTDSEEAEMIVEQVERLIGGTSYFALDSGRVASHEGEQSLSFGDIGILYRLNAQGDALELALNRAGLPIIRSGETPLLDRFPANLIWRFLQSAESPANNHYTDLYQRLLADSGVNAAEYGIFSPRDGSLVDLIEQFVSHYGLDCSSEEAAEVLERLKNLAENFDRDRPALLDALCLERGIDHEVLFGDRIALMTLHAAKGLEWEVAFITGCEDGLLPCSLFGDRDEEEERRLFYVGMTRARQRLILSHAAQRTLNNRRRPMQPSPFLKSIPAARLRPLDRREWKPKKRPHKQLELF